MNALVSSYCDNLGHSKVNLIVNSALDGLSPT